MLPVANSLGSGPQTVRHLAFEEEVIERRRPPAQVSRSLRPAVVGHRPTLSGAPQAIATGRFSCLLILALLILQKGWVEERREMTSEVAPQADEAFFKNLTHSLQLARNKKPGVSFCLGSHLLRRHFRRQDNTESEYSVEVHLGVELVTACRAQEGNYGAVAVSAH